MSKYDGAKIEVKNWEEYNPRSETKRPSWFRCENDLATSEKLFGLSCEQKWLWLVILSLLSKRNGKAITWSSSYVHAVSGVSPKVQDATIEIFEKIFDLHVTRTEACETRTDAYEIRTDSCGTRALRTNERNERDETNELVRARASVSDLEAVYQKYPRKMGKAPGMKRLKTQIATQEDLAELNRAMDAFVAFHRQKGTEAQFIPHFSTWTTSWRDWLDPETGTADAPSAGTPIDFAAMISRSP